MGLRRQKFRALPPGLDSATAGTAALCAANTRRHVRSALGGGFRPVKFGPVVARRRRRRFGGNRMARAGLAQPGKFGPVLAPVPGGRLRAACAM